MVAAGSSLRASIKGYRTSSAPGGKRGEARLRGWRLVVARALVGAAMVIVAALFFWALPESHHRLATPCSDPTSQCLITPEHIAPLASLGVSPGALALAAIALSCLMMALVFAAAVILIWRRSDDWMALLVTLTLVLTPINSAPVLMTLREHPGVWPIAAAALSEASAISLFLFIALFPSGGFAPRWLWAPLALLLLVFGPVELISLSLPIAAQALLLLGILLCLVASQIYRYRRISTPMQRQQTKWVVYGLIFLIVVNQLFWQTYILIPELHQPGALYILLAYPVDFLMVAILVVSLGVAIRRYRLWDIDAIINQTLVYGSLTMILASIYVAGVIGGQRIVSGLTHASDQEQSPLIVVITTLIIAALFQPLRRRIQLLIDRRFYRHKYDMARTLSAFGATLREEVELRHLTDSLLDTIEETMRPAHVSLWLRDNARPQQSGST